MSHCARLSRRSTTTAADPLLQLGPTTEIAIQLRADSTSQWSAGSHKRKINWCKIRTRWMGGERVMSRSVTCAHNASPARVGHVAAGAGHDGHALRPHPIQTSPGSAQDGQHNRMSPGTRTVSWLEPRTLCVSGRRNGGRRMSLVYREVRRGRQALGHRFKLLLHGLDRRSFPQVERVVACGAVHRDQK
jgi:hypothetical protein